MRSHGGVSPHRAVTALTLAAMVVLLPGSGPLAQEAVTHLNPMIAKLAKGEPVFGVSTADLSMENAHAIERSAIESVRIEMEHGPMDFSALRNFLLGMIDKAEIHRKGTLQPNVAPWARFAPYGRERADWIAKQALDMGLMGVAFNGVDNPEQALAAVRSMRYPQPKGAPFFQPAGLRGYSPSNALWFWGIASDEYMRHADLWPLNPTGDLLCIIMIESAEGLKNADAIASVPGVGMIFPGAAYDLALSLGVSPTSADAEQGLQTILKACLAHNVPCGVVAGASDVQKRVREGWKYLEIGGANGGLTAPADAALRAGRSAR
jgi:4-hydroxy-2-oxoheptanedioate aldolase